MNKLAADLSDHADGIEQVTLHKLEQDIRTAARVASDMAQWRFALSELAASLPAGNFARNEILKLLGKDIAAAEPDLVFAFATQAREAYAAWRADGSTELCNTYTAAQGALFEAKPKTLEGYLTKWRTFIHSERELEMDNIDFHAAMSQMLDELAAVQS